MKNMFTLKRMIGYVKTIYFRSWIMEIQELYVTNAPQEMQEKG